MALSTAVETAPVRLNALRHALVMAKIALSGPADLLATIPYHLGFHPSRSVVVVCFHANRLGLMARLNAADGPDVAHCLETLLPVLQREAPTSVTLAAFETRADETMSLRRGLLQGLGAAEITVREQLLVRGARWFRLDCHGAPSPPEGRAMPLDADVPAVAAFVGLGQAVMRDRESMARLVAPLTDRAPGHDATVRAVELWQQRYRWSLDGAQSAEMQAGGQSPEAEQVGADHLVAQALECWRLLLSQQPFDRFSPAVVAQLVAPLRFAELRDALIAWLCPGTMSLGHLDPVLQSLLTAHLGDDLRGALDRGDAPAVREVAALAPRGTGGQEQSPFLPGSSGAWRTASEHGNGGTDQDDWEAAATTRLIMSRLASLCRQTPSGQAAPALALLACYAWWAGDGALAGMAVDQALELEADHRLSGLVRTALDHGLRVMGTAA